MEPVAEKQGDVTEQYARELLEAVDSGSAPELMELLAKIIRVEPQAVQYERRERERLELLQGIALRMRMDLHAMLMHIYQRLEASRTYLDVVRHLAGDSPEGVSVNLPEERQHVIPWPTSRPSASLPGRAGRNLPASRKASKD